MNAEAEACITACFFIVLIAAGMVGIAYLLTKNSFNRFNTPNKDMLKMLDDKENVIELANIKAMVYKVIKLQPPDVTAGGDPNQQDVKEILTLIQSIMEPAMEAAAESTGQVETIVGARDAGRLQILKETRAGLASHPTSLHVSRVKDLYGNILYLAAAPLQAQFADHWELIWQEDIGIIVWIGRFQPMGQAVRMEPYIEMKEGQTIKHGQFQVTTMKVLERHLKFFVYHVRLENGRSKKTISILHAYEWLQESVTWALRRDTELIIALKDEHVERSIAGQPNIMFQCKWGTAGSPTMATVYIGFQMWLAAHKVNMIGILKYVRRHRWKSFQETGEDSHTFLVQVKVAYTVMYALATFIEKKQLPLFDPWLKSVLMNDPENPPVIPQ